MPLVVAAVATGLLSPGAPAQITPVSVTPVSVTPVSVAPVSVAPETFDVSRATVQSLTPVLAGDGSMTIAVQLDGELVSLRLSPHSMRSPRFAVGGVDALAPEARTSAAPATWRGVAIGEPASVVAATIREGRVRAVVRVDAQLWGIEPLPTDAPGADGDPTLHVVYAAKDIVAPPGLCGGELIAPDGAAPPAGELAGEGGPCNLVCQIAFDADVEYFVSNGSSVENTVADIEAILNAVEAIYLFDTGISYLLTHVIVRTQEPDPYDDNGAQALLAQFRDHWNDEQQSVPRDVAHLMTGRNLSGTTIGIAYLSVVCNLPSAYGLTQSKWTNNFVLRTATTAHELGHNWGAPHCNSDPECSIMCSTISGCSGVVTSFNPGTVAQIVQYRDNVSCLGPGEQVAPIANDDELYAQAGAQTVLDVLANDLELNCDDVVFTDLPAQTAAGGTVAPCIGCLPGGWDGLTYTAVAGEASSDSFSYTIVDPFGAADTAQVSVSIVELRPADLPASTTPGLLSKVYLTEPLTALPDFATLTPFYDDLIVLLFNFPASSGEVLFTGQTDNVAAVFEGYLEAPTSDIYTLYLESSDGSRLFIGDQLVIDNDGLHGMIEANGVIGLQAGKHALRVEFFEATGVYGLIARWKSSTIEKSIVPLFWFSHGPPVVSAGPADLNEDGVVDASDLEVLLGAWGGSGPGDLDGDGTVDAADLGILLGAWGGG